MSKPYRLPQVEEQTVLDELEIQEVGPEDYPRFQSLLRRHHYLQGIKPVGGAALLCGAVARPMAGVAGLLRGGPASASSRPVDWVDRSSAAQAFEFGGQIGRE